MALMVPAEFEAEVMSRVRAGEYASADDVFAVCLELLRREDNDYEAKLAWLQAALDEAEGEIAAGKGIDGEQAIEQALEAYRKAARS